MISSKKNIDRLVASIVDSQADKSMQPCRGKHNVFEQEKIDTYVTIGDPYLAILQSHMGGVSLKSS